MFEFATFEYINELLIAMEMHNSILPSNRNLLNMSVHCSLCTIFKPRVTAACIRNHLLLSFIFCLFCSALWFWLIVISLCEEIIFIWTCEEKEWVWAYGMRSCRSSSSSSSSPFFLSLSTCESIVSLLGTSHAGSVSGMLNVLLSF